MTRIIKFYETTLRDGEQTPGINYFPEEKLQIAQALAEMGFDTLDCGFPISGAGEFEAVQLIARTVPTPRFAPLPARFPRTLIAPGKRSRTPRNQLIQPFISTSPLHRQVKLGKTREEVLELARTAVARGRSYTREHRFCAGRHDAHRTRLHLRGRGRRDERRRAPRRHLRYRWLRAALGVWRIDRGTQARVSRRAHFGALPRRSGPGRRQRHGRLIRNGADRVDTCINGLGERAGNAASEEVVMAIRTRRADLDVDVKVDTTKIIPTSRLVAKLSGMQPQWTKAIVGANAFAHGGGIHQDGVLKDTRTYEIMTPGRRWA